MTPALLATCAGPMLLDFGEASIRALRDGRKTETRTILCSGRGNLIAFDGKVATFQDSIPDDPCPLTKRLRYQPGKRYYVAESFALCPRNPSEPKWSDNPEEARAIYRADGELELSGPNGFWSPKWRHGRFMPRAAARYVVEVTGSRVERLQAITEEGARAEGCRASDAAVVFQADAGEISCHIVKEMCGTFRGAFACAWDARHKRAPWASNPWVEVSTIRMVTA